MKIPLFQITVNDGRRKASPEAVQELANSISKVGLLNPITVDQEHTLIAGLHRLEAAKLLGWPDIECTVSSLAGLLAELAEVDENVVRKGLSAVEYSDLLLRRKEIYEMLHPETKNGGDRKSEKIRIAKCKSDSAKPFIQDTAEKLGVHPATVARQIQTAKNLTSEAKDIIRDTGTKITKKDALKLSRLGPEQQEDAARQLATKAIRSIDDYNPAPAEPKAAEAPEIGAEPTSTAPASGEACYPTTRDSVADLKNPDKDRSRTTDTFLASFSFFLQRFCQSITIYASPENAAVFPALTQQQLDQIRQEVNSTCSALRNLLHKMERTAQNELPQEKTHHQRGA